jgi:lipoprotein-anchoring transpeptidase ErfK/SrfK
VSRQRKSSKRSGRLGDFIGWLIVLAFLGGLGWFWWQKEHPTIRQKISTSARVEKPKKITPPAPVAVPVQPPPVARPVPPVASEIMSVAFPRPVRDVLEAQVALARRVISPGAIDAAMGSQTRAAILTFQRGQKIPATGALDPDTRSRLTLASLPLTAYTVTTNDLASLQPMGKTWLEKSEQSALAYETELELVAEAGHANPALIRQLNPGVNWTNIAAGTVLQIPEANYPEPTDKAAFVVIHLSERFLEAFDAETNLLAHFPCSIAAKVEKRPVGELQVTVIAPNPNYTVNPELFPESSELQAIGHKIILPPGPNNPVGVAWIGLNLPGYGMHGTPVPELVGRTESHGCFRLANWDAAYLLKLAWIGMPVEVEP